MYTEIVDTLKNSSFDIHAAEFISHGEVVMHEAFAPDVRYPVYSAAKSITSAAFSLCCDDGLLTPETELARFLDERCRKLMSEQFAQLSFERFLTMTAGNYPFRPSGDDWLENILSLEIDHSDSSFHYSNIPAYLVGVACENAVGEPLGQFLERRLFAPLGIEKPVFSLSPEGHFYGATGMELTVHEFALFGQLYLGRGAFNGRRIISQGSVDMALTPRVETGSGDSYGYFFRIANDHFSAVGKWGQRCMVFPEKELVVAYLANEPERSGELYGFMLSLAEKL